MSDSNSVTAAVVWGLSALGIVAIRPDVFGVGVGMGMMGSYLMRAVTPSESRAEAWLIPIAAAFVCIIAAMAQPHLPMGIDAWHPSLVMATAGSFSVPALRAMQMVGAALPHLVKRAVNDRVGGKKDD